MRKWEIEQTPKGRCNNIIWQELCRRGGRGGGLTGSFLNTANTRRSETGL